MGALRGGGHARGGDAQHIPPRESHGHTMCMSKQSEVYVGSVGHGVQPNEDKIAFNLNPGLVYYGLQLALLSCVPRYTCSLQ